MLPLKEVFGMKTDRLAYEAKDLWNMLPLSRATVYELLAAGKIRHVRVGRRILIPREAVEELLQHGVEHVRQK